MARIRDEKQRPRKGQGAGRSRVPRASTVALSALLLLGAGAAGAQSVTVQPTLQMRLTLTDNINASEDKKSDWVAEVSPGVSIARDSGRFSGRLNASFRNLVHARESRRDNSFLALQGAGEIEAIENTFFVELDAAISRDNVALFGGRPSDDFIGADRRNQTRSYTIAPRLEFGLGPVADARIRHSTRWLEGDGALSNQRYRQWDAELVSARVFGPLGWALTHTRGDSSTGDTAIRDATQKVTRGTLFYAVSPQLRLRAVVGRESNDFDEGRSTSETIRGAGFNWFPSTRTSIAAGVERRIFGRGYNLDLSHRHARSTWELSVGRDITSSVQRFGSVFQDPLFAAFFNSPLFIALFPDPLDRENFLRAQLGLTGDSFVSNAYFVDRRVRAGVTLAGTRNTVSFSLQRSDRARLSGLTGLRADDAFADLDRVRTQSAALSLNHRLSGLSSLNASVSRSTARGSGVDDRKTRRSSAAVGYTTSLGPRTAAGLTVRHNRSSGDAEYTENVISANLGMRF